MATPLCLASQIPPSTPKHAADEEGDRAVKRSRSSEVEEGDDDRSSERLCISEEEALKKYLAMVSELPKEAGWLSEHIHQYQGFWYSSAVLKGVLILQQRFQSEPTDVLLASFPKSGTTWLKALLVAITEGTENSPLLRANPHELVPMLESYAAENPANPRPKPSSSSSSSLMSTHIPYCSLPESMKTSGCRVVYVFRDPKDVLVSCWHFVKKLKPESVAPISLENAFRQFCRGASAYGSYWDHVLGYWKASIEFPDKVLFLRYEELKKEPCENTRRLSEFLGHCLKEEEAVGKVVDLCSFERLSELEVNRSGAHSGFGFPVIENKIFFRQGKVGDSKNHLTAAMIEEIDGIAKEKFKEFPDLFDKKMV